MLHLLDKQHNAAAAVALLNNDSANDSLTTPLLLTDAVAAHRFIADKCRDAAAAIAFAASMLKRFPHSVRFGATTIQPADDSKLTEEKNN